MLAINSRCPILRASGHERLFSSTTSMCFYTKIPLQWTILSFAKFYSVWRAKIQAFPPIRCTTLYKSSKIHVQNRNIIKKVQKIQVWKWWSSNQYMDTKLNRLRHIISTHICVPVDCSRINRSIYYPPVLQIYRDST